MAENWGAGIAANVLLILISAAIAGVCGAILYAIWVTLTKPVAEKRYAFQIFGILSLILVFSFVTYWAA